MRGYVSVLPGFVQLHQIMECYYVIKDTRSSFKYFQFLNIYCFPQTLSWTECQPFVFLCHRKHVIILNDLLVLLYLWPNHIFIDCVSRSWINVLYSRLLSVHSCNQPLAYYLYCHSGPLISIFPPLWTYTDSARQPGVFYCLSVFKYTSVHLPLFWLGHRTPTSPLICLAVARTLLKGQRRAVNTEEMWKQLSMMVKGKHRSSSTMDHYNHLLLYVSIALNIPAEMQQGLNKNRLWLEHKPDIKCTMTKYS